MRSAVCLIVKNEAKYISEWISYYLCSGFDEIVILDNESDDETAEIVERAQSRCSAIRYNVWHNVHGQAPQGPACREALRNTDSDWMAFFDIDEFLVLKKHRSVNEFLSQFDESVGAVCLNWILFGSAGQKNYSEGLIIQRFQRRAAGFSELVKSFVRPSLVKEIHAHAPFLKEGAKYSNSLGMTVDLGQKHCRLVPSADPDAYINHYVLKSEEEYEWKKQRGQVGQPTGDVAKRSKFAPQFFEFCDRNEVFDDGMEGMAEQTLRKMHDLFG